MPQTKLRLENTGQIRKVEVTIGDLTVLVGPQATGKSIFLQFLRLLVDAGHVLDELKRYGLDWGWEVKAFFDIYFGEGMGTAWRPEERRVTFNEQESGETRDISNLDPGSTGAFEAGWGGLSEFSGRVADVVARAEADQAGER